MPSLTINDISERLLDRLTIEAKREHRSLNEHVLSCLERLFESATVDDDQREEVARRIRARTSHVSITAKDVRQAIERGR